MYYYRQHRIVLLVALFECLLLGLLGAVLNQRSGHPAFLILILPAVLIAIRRILAWRIFSIRLKGQQITMRSLRGLLVRESVVLCTNDAVRMQQSVPGYLFNYGELRIETYDQPIKFRYIASFSLLRRQIHLS